LRGPKKNQPSPAMTAAAASPTTMADASMVNPPDCLRAERNPAAERLSSPESSSIPLRGRAFCWAATRT
jgi:hypothetical protein